MHTAAISPAMMPVMTGRRQWRFGLSTRTVLASTRLAVDVMGEYWCLARPTSR
jgi:hypothetical protein